MNIFTNNTNTTNAITSFSFLFIHFIYTMTLRLYACIVCWTFASNRLDWMGPVRGPRGLSRYSTYRACKRRKRRTTTSLSLSLWFVVVVVVSWMATINLICVVVIHPYNNKSSQGPNKPTNWGWLLLLLLFHDDDGCVGVAVVAVVAPE